MALSGSYSFTVNRDEIIREGMLNIGAIGEGEVPTAQEVTDCARKLNLIVKQWMGQLDFAPGLKMWERQRGDLFLSSTKYQYALGPSGDNFAGGVTAVPGANYATQKLSANAVATATTLSFGVGKVGNLTANDYLVVQLDSGDIYSTTVSSVNSGAGTIAIPSPGLPSQASVNAYVWNYTTKAQRPLGILTAILRDINNADIPLDIMDLQQYELLPNKTDPNNISDPAAIYYESQFASGTSVNGPGQLYIDVAGAQDVTKIIHMVFLRSIQDMNSSTDNPEFPQQWYRALCWGLSREICGMFDAEWTPDMDLNYRESVAMARHADPETTTLYFQSEDF
jgi:hypothetical protein